MTSPLFGALERLAESGALEPVAMGILGGGSNPAPAPAVPEPIKPPPLPDLEGPEARDARRRQLLRAAGSSGRASTTLSAQSEYSSDKTGVA